MPEAPPSISCGSVIIRWAKCFLQAQGDIWTARVHGHCQRWHAPGGDASPGIHYRVHGTALSRQACHASTLPSVASVLEAAEERKRCFKRAEFQTTVGGIGLQGFDVGGRGSAVDGPLVA